MTITHIDVIPLRLPYQRELKISRGSVGSPAAGAPHILVRVTGKNGREGWGEARPSHRWSYETEESVISTITNYLTPAVLGRDVFDVRGLHAAMAAEIAPGISIGQPIAKSAVDMAVHDLIGNTLNLPLDACWGSRSAQTVRLSYIVSAETPEEAERQAAAGMAQGYEGFKVKVGLHVDRDLEILKAIIRTAPGRYIWADANQAYDVATAIRLGRKMEDLGVDVLEQPLPATDRSGLRKVVASVGIPVVVDESVYTVRDLIDLIRLDALDGVVIKVSKAGGLWYARQMVETALGAGLLVLGSGLTESRLGLMASARLFAAYGMSIPADLNGPQFLADDAVEGSIAAIGPTLTLPDRPGLGVRVDEEKIKKYEVRRPKDEGQEKNTG